MKAAPRISLALASVAAVVSLPACGEHTKSVEVQAGASTSTRPPVGTSNEAAGGVAIYAPVDRDRDNDISAGRSDDKTNERSYDEYGRRLGPAEQRAVATLIKRYYSLGLADDGSAACRLIIPTLSSSVAEDYGRAGGPIAMRGVSNCAQGVDKLFASARTSLAKLVPTMRILQVRGHDRVALAVLRIGQVERRLLVQREHGVWAIAQLIDAPVN